MSKIKHIFDPIFTQNFWYIEAKTHKQYAKIVKEKWDIELPEKTGTNGEMVPIEKKGQEIILIWTEKNDLKSIVHECMHATAYSLRRHGTELTDSSEETYCYLIAFLFKEILSNKIDKDFPIRKGLGKGL